MKMMKKALILGVLAALPFIAPVRAHALNNNAITVQKIVKSGVTGSYTVGIASGTDQFSFQNDGRTFLYVKKTGAGASTLTIVAQATVQGLAVANQTVTIPATTGDVFIGPFPASVFNDASNNTTFNFTDITGLTFAVLRL